MIEKNGEALLKCTEKEKKLLELIRSLEFGEIRVIISNSQPDSAEDIRKSIRL